ncbi:Histidine utilization repressor [hydrothermal vent metagenome]|jgi:GntR family histidine utilization transcriptional repressor|uniref:Histidine utilization repressor n=1 Tax=hydrothermal vent metagenome TaxID=652676 RepID=A0A160TJ48_9ZZZZ
MARNAADCIDSRMKDHAEAGAMAATDERTRRAAGHGGRAQNGDPPRYVEIKQSIVGALRSGELKPGDRVPSEAELVSRFGVSRMTANRALRELSNAGVVVRRAGAGSFIAEPRPIGQMIEIRNIADEVRARGRAYRARVIDNIAIRADQRSAALLEVAAGTRLFRSVIVHHEAEFPIQLEERFVLAAAAPDYGAIDFHETTPNEYLTRVAPLERVEHRVRAAMPDSGTRLLLGIDEGEPVLVMTRRTWSRGRLVSHAVLTHPGRSFELSAAFSVDTG